MKTNKPPYIDYFRPLKLKVSEKLEGSKVGYIVGYDAFVSPAMGDLIKSADKKELEYLLKHIGFVDVPLKSEKAEELSGKGAGK